MVSVAFVCMFTDKMWGGASESDSFIKQLFLVLNKSLVFDCQMQVLKSESSIFKYKMI